MVLRAAATLIGVLILLLLAGAKHDGVEVEITRLDAAIRSQPESASLYLRRGEMLRLRRDLLGSRADLERALELDAELAGLALARGRLLLDGGCPIEALAVLDEHLAGEPLDTRALHLRAEARVLSCDPLGAVSDYGRVIALSARPIPEHYLARADVLAGMGSGGRAQAVAGIDEGIARIGPATTLLLRAVDLEVALGRHDAALARLQVLADFSTRKEAWYARRGDVLAAAGRSHEALDEYRRARHALFDLRPKRRATQAAVALHEHVERRLRELGAR